MVEEPETTTNDDAPRRCPACGSRVASHASTCLMCGTSLDEPEPVPESSETEKQRKLPGWVRALIVVGLTLLFLAAGALGFYRLMRVDPAELTPTVTPSRTPTPSPTMTPSPTPPPTHTPTPVPPRVHQVQPDETLSEIAERYGVQVSEILALNPDLDAELIQVGQVMLIPPDLSLLVSNEPTATSENFIVHVVVAGETLGEIAEKYGVSVELIRIANELSEDAGSIQANQSLEIPAGTPVPSPTPITDVNATPTPIPLYVAPPLLSPLDGVVLSTGDTPIMLAWASVSTLRKNEWYEVQLFQTSGGVISQTVLTRATSWRLPSDLLPQVGEPQTDFSWRVRIVRERASGSEDSLYENAGELGPTRVFAWLSPTPAAASDTDQ